MLFSEFSFASEIVIIFFICFVNLPSFIKRYANYEEKFNQCSYKTSTCGCTLIFRSELEELCLMENDQSHCNLTLNKVKYIKEDAKEANALTTIEETWIKLKIYPFLIWKSLIFYYNLWNIYKICIGLN